MVADPIFYFYDLNGNIASSSDGVRNAWDYQNRLMSSAQGSSTVSYAYDHAGSRIKKQSAKGTTIYPSTLYEVRGSTTTKHIYQGDMLVASVEKGSTTPAKIFHTYLDHLGSTDLVIDQDGVISEDLEYYPFGEPLSDVGTYKESNQYIGQDYDSESSLSYLQARYYAGKRGQFISQDPVFWEIGQTRDGITILHNPQAQNSYSYSQNNPVTNIDPDGRCGTVCVVLWGLLTPNVAYAPAEGEEGYTNAYLETTITAVGLMSPGNRASKITQLAKNQAKGQAGEIASGIVKNTEKIPSITKPGTSRIPDELDHSSKVIGDVKNVNYQSFSSQLKDFTAYAQNNSYKLVLTVDQRTRLSQTLQNLGKQLEVIRKDLNTIIKKKKND